MPLLPNEITDRLASLDEMEICDILCITSADILARFADVVEENMDKLENIVDWD